MSIGRVVFLVIAVGFLSAATALAHWPRDNAEAPLPFVADIGGPFTLVNVEGETVTREDILGRPHAVFFGYTFCPDVCPTTLFEMSTHLDAMGKTGDALDVYFISVDVERDTPSHLREYLKAFDDRIEALTGTREHIDEAAASYRIQYEVHSNNANGHFIIDHTASVLLFNADGIFQGTIGYGEDTAVARTKLERLAKGA